MYTLTKFLISILMVSVINCYSQSDGFQSSKKHIQLSTGIDMAYVDLGENNEETIILLHGYTDSSRSFQNVIQEINQLHPEARIIVADLRGHGNTTLPKSNEDFKLSDFSNDILDLASQLKLDKYHLVGHSFGSIVAQSIALSRPDLVKSLVLIGTFVNGKKNVTINDFLYKELIYGQWKDQLQGRFGTDWQTNTFSLTPADLGENVSNFLKDAWVSEPRAPSYFLNSVYQETIHTPLITWFETLKTMVEFDHSINLSALKTPTLIIWGEDDDVTPEVPDQQDVKKALQIANQTLGTVIYYKTYSKSHPDQLNVGHNLHWALPKEIAIDITGFIQAKVFNVTFNSDIYQLKK